MSDIEKVSSGTGDLVVVGSSAGGVEALSILVSTLPADFPAPIVLAQHLDPNRPSSLDSILQRRTQLSIDVVNSRTHLQPGKIYVVPANRHVTIDDSYVEVQGDHNKRPRPSVDLLFSSAAEVYGERLIAVILTGSGSDGAAGAVDVKNAGGTVIVQDPQTARYPSMPLALPPTLVDFEVAVERIGALLYDLLKKGESLPQPEEKTDDVLRSILEQVSRQANIDFRPYKSSTILRRISRRMAVTHCSTMHDYLDYLKANPQEVGELVKAFLINVTQFFRDSDAFTYLKSEILPKLIARGRERDHTLRVWAAGCATGEEAYSLAMLITDLLGPELSEWSVKIFATDVDEAAISFARRGLYSENLLRDVPANYKDHFFERVDHGYRISKMLRQMIIFGQQDLSRSAPFPRIDLVLCRNVLIYFTPELQEYVLNQFTFSLSPGGYLFLGKAETVRPLQTFYELANKHWKVYRCLGSALPAARRPNLADLNVPRLEGHANNRLNRSAEKEPVDQDSSASSPELGQLRRFNELLLRFSPIGIVVIDRAYHVLTANGAARRLLGLREVAHEQDFLHAIRGIPYSDVRAAIDAVFRDRNMITLPEVELDIAVGGSGRFISLSISPMHLEASMPELASISIIDVTEQVQIRRQLEAVQTEQTQLMNELSAANKRLNDVNKDLLDANEELQVANEELMLTHEELQASIEEFETTNEELQATNEELETNNEELQATNEELETTNDELRARTSELQELTGMLESERVQLAEMVELSPFYIMVLRGPNLLVEAFNPRYAGLLSEQEVQGRPLEVVFELFWEAGIPLVRLAHEVYQQNVTRVTSRMLTPVPGPDGELTANYFVYTLVPSHDASGKVSGVIIYAVDETAQRAREFDEERQRLKLIFDHSYRVALALFDAETTELIIGSPRYLDIARSIHGSDGNNLIGCKWQDLTFFVSGDEAASLWNRARESHTPMRLPETHWKPAAGEQEIVWDYSLTPILDIEKQDTIRYMLVSALDVTEQNQVRQEMERLNRLKDEFLSLASHELRTPLTSIKGNAEILQRNLKRSSKEEDQITGIGQAQHILDSIIHQVKRLTDMITEMLDITRIHNEQFELKNRKNVNIVELVRQVVEQHNVTTDHPITLETQQEEVQVNCDEARIEQVLSNLISNAIKYSPAEKPVVIGIERTGDEVIVAVRDEGHGMSEEQQAHVFERFYRAHSEENGTVEGLGLGLYIAHEIITQHGGRICVESEPGKGSTFYFSLPL
ncbi:MAG: CheR family methyltransferase [Ktedonobacteraceae bacterium]